MSDKLFKSFCAVGLILFSLLGAAYAEDLVISDFKFGLMQKNVYGNYQVYEETNVIPHRAGIAFGYTYFYKNDSDKKIIEKVVLKLPSPAEKIDIESKVQSSSEINPLKTLVVSNSVLDAKEGIWPITMVLDEGDPLGKYGLEIYIDDKLFKQIEFDIVKDK